MFNFKKISLVVAVPALVLGAVWLAYPYFSLAAPLCQKVDDTAWGKDYTKALNYYRRCAANPRDAESMYKVATFYYKGLGVDSPDFASAFRLYESAAALGYEPAQVMAGAMSMMGAGRGAVDKAEGYKWLILAGEPVDKRWFYEIGDFAPTAKAAEYLARFNPSLSKVDKAKGMERAGEFKQARIVLMAKKVLPRDEYADFVARYQEGGEARAAALEGLRVKALAYKQAEK